MSRRSPSTNSSAPLDREASAWRGAMLLFGLLAVGGAVWAAWPVERATTPAWAPQSAGEGTSPASDGPSPFNPSVFAVSLRWHDAPTTSAAPEPPREPPMPAFDWTPIGLRAAANGSAADETSVLLFHAPSRRVIEAQVGDTIEAYRVREVTDNELVLVWEERERRLPMQTAVGGRDGRD